MNKAGIIFFFFLWLVSISSFASENIQSHDPRCLIVQNQFESLKTDELIRHLSLRLRGSNILIYDQQNAEPCLLLTIEIDTKQNATVTLFASNSHDKIFTHDVQVNDLPSSMVSRTIANEVTQHPYMIQIIQKYKVLESTLPTMVKTVLFREPKSSLQFSGSVEHGFFIIPQEHFVTQASSLRTNIVWLQGTQFGLVLGIEYPKTIQHDNNFVTANSFRMLVSAGKTWPFERLTLETCAGAGVFFSQIAQENSGKVKNVYEEHRQVFTLIAATVLASIPIPKFRGASFITSVDTHYLPYSEAYVLNTKTVFDLHTFFFISSFGLRMDFF